MQKNATAAAGDDIERRGRVKIFKDVAVNHSASSNLGTNLATHAQVKIFNDQTNVDSKRVLLKQPAAGPTFSAMHHSTSCHETVPASSRHLGEEVETEIGRLSGGLSDQELREVYSRVFCRRWRDFCLVSFLLLLFIVDVGQFILSNVTLLMILIWQYCW